VLLGSKERMADRDVMEPKDQWEKPESVAWLDYQETQEQMVFPDQRENRVTEELAAMPVLPE